MELLRRRVRIEPAAARRRRPPFEACFLGHAPGSARPDALTAYAADQLVQLGLAPSATLRQLPLALRSAGEFHALFPDARSTPARYASRVAGAAAWLPRAVEDYFRAGGELLWVIVVDEPSSDDLALSHDDFLPPNGGVDLSRRETWRGIAALLHLPSVGVVALPDLERLSIPADVVSVAHKTLPNPAPAFIPVSSERYVPGEERRNAEEMAAARAPAPVDLARFVPPLLDFLARWRRDVSLLLTLPLDSHPGAPEPVLAPAARDWIAGERGDGKGLTDEQVLRLARIAPLFPYLRGPRYRLLSPCGVVAGAIAKRAASDGAWRSVAGRPLPSDAVASPAVATRAIADLRDLGVGVLTHERGALRLDDERTLAPGDARSAELQRFRGWLLRELERIGLELVFEPENVAKPARLALEQWLTDLFRRGALQGKNAADAFAVRELPRREGTIGFEIEVRPSLPIDRLVLSFLHLEGRWQAEASDG